MLQNEPGVLPKRFATHKRYWRRCRHRARCCGAVLGAVVPCSVLWCRAIWAQPKPAVSLVLVQVTAVCRTVWKSCVEQNSVPSLNVSGCTACPSPYPSLNVWHRLKNSNFTRHPIIKAVWMQRCPGFTAHGCDDRRLVWVGC